jgi:four helix bundle protein
MSAVKTYRDLEAWHAGMTLVEVSYRVTRGFPNDERFGLSAQLRRAAIAVPPNVAEGPCRR